jgi:TonB-dependent receptor
MKGAGSTIRLLRSTLLLLLIPFVSGGMEAQSNTAALEGRVVGDQGRPLAGASVQIEGLERGVLSDADGRFVLRDLPSGTAEVAISSIGFATEAFTVTLRAGETLREEFVLAVSPLALQELIVEGQVGQAEAYNRQRTAPSVRNIVSSDHIERFPDSSIPDVLRRMPGVAAQPDRGETGFVFIRGLSPDFTTVTIDGARVPSTDRSGRGVELSSIPAELIESLEVIKAITPDMDADAVGGSINMTARRPTRRQWDGRLEGGGHSLIDGVTRRGALTYGNVVGPFSFVLGGDFATQFRQTENLQYWWDDYQGESILDRLRLQHYPIERTKYSGNGTLNYTLGDGRSFLFVRGIYSRYDTEEERHRVTYRIDSGDRVSRTDVAGGRVERQARQYRWERSILDLTAGGNHFLSNGVHLDYNLSFSEGIRREPYRNYFEFRQSGVDMFADASENRAFPVLRVTGGGNPDDLSSFGLRYYEQRFDDAMDRDLGGQINVTVPLPGAVGVPGSLRLGTKLSNKDKERDFDRIRFDEMDGSFHMGLMGTSSEASPITPRNYPFGPRLDWSQGEDFWDANQALFRNDQNREREESDTEDYEARERIASLYGMATLDFGPVEIIAGARFEHTSTAYAGKRLSFDANGDFTDVQEVEADQSFGSFFPAFHLRYRVDDATNVRFAATRTIARPGFLSVAPNEFIRFDDQIITRGNPELRPGLSYNLDLMAERYFASVGMISGGVFYKSIDDFFFQRRSVLQGGEFDGFELRQAANGARARVYGVELAWHQRLDFLPGALGGLGVYANYTYSGSSTEGLAGSDRDLPLPEQVPHIANVALNYDLGGFQGLVSLNHQSTYLGRVGSSADQDRYFRFRNQVDASFTQRVTPNARVFLQLNNITNEPYMRWDGSRDFLDENEFEGVWGSLGLRFNF